MKSFRSLIFLLFIVVTACDPHYAVSSEPISMDTKPSRQESEAEPQGKKVKDKPLWTIKKIWWRATLTCDGSNLFDKVEIVEETGDRGQNINIECRTPGYHPISSFDADYLFTVRNGKYSFTSSSYAEVKESEWKKFKIGWKCQVTGYHAPILISCTK